MTGHQGNESLLYAKPCYGDFPPVVYSSVREANTPHPNYRVWEVSFSGRLKSVWFLWGLSAEKNQKKETTREI